MMSTNNDEKKKNKKEEDEDEDEEGGRSESNEREGAASNNRGQSPTYPTEHREGPGVFGTTAASGSGIAGAGAGAEDGAESDFLAAKLAIAGRSDAVRQRRARRKQDEGSSPAAGGTGVALGTAGGAIASNSASSGTDGKKRAVVGPSRITGPKTGAAEAAFRGRRKGAATAASSKSGKTRSWPETISADEPPPPPGHAHSASRGNRALLKEAEAEAEEEKEEIVPSDPTIAEDGLGLAARSATAAMATTSFAAQPETFCAEEPPDPSGRRSHRFSNRDAPTSATAGAGAAAAFDSLGESGKTRVGGRPETIPLEEPPLPPGHEIDSAEECAGTDDGGDPNLVRKEGAGEGVAVGTAVASAAAAYDSREARPGVVPVPAPDADDYGTTRLSRHASSTAEGAAPAPPATTEAQAEAVGTVMPVDREGGQQQQHQQGEDAQEEIVAVVFDEEQQRRLWLDELQATAPAATAVVALPRGEEEGTATAVEGKTICGIHRFRFLVTLALIAIAAAVVTMGALAGTGSFDRGTAGSGTPSPTTSPMPSESPVPTWSPTSPPSMSPTPLPTQPPSAQPSSAPTECKPPTTKLLPNDGAAGNEFGWSVAVDGDTVVIGAYLDDDNGFSSGSAYVFTRTGTAWAQQAKLLPDDGAAGDWFGGSVAVDGDTVVIGADGDDDNGSWSGSAYVFTRTGTAWAQQAKLLPNDGVADDRFGTSVSLDGNTAVIGADQWDSANGSGKAYVFTRSGTAWSQQKRLLPDDGAGGDRFGYSVAVDGTTVFVGAPEDDNDNGEDSGGAYSFELC